MARRRKSPYKSPGKVRMKAPKVRQKAPKVRKESPTAKAIGKLKVKSLGLPKLKL